MPRVRPRDNFDDDFRLVDDALQTTVSHNLHTARMLKRSHNVLRRVNDVLSDDEVRAFQDKVKSAHKERIGLCVEEWLNNGGPAYELASIARTAKL